MSRISCVSSGGCLPEWGDVSFKVSEVFSRIWQVICNCFRAIRSWCGAESVEASPIIPSGNHFVEGEDQFFPHEQEVLLWIEAEILPGYEPREFLYRCKGQVIYRFSSGEAEAPAVLCDCLFTDNSWEISLCKEEEKPSCFAKIIHPLYGNREEEGFLPPVYIKLSPESDEKCLSNEHKESPEDVQVVCLPEQESSSSIRLQISPKLWPQVGGRGVFVDQVLANSFLLQEVERASSPLVAYQKKLDELRESGSTALAYEVYTTPLCGSLLLAMQDVWNDSATNDISPSVYYRSKLASDLECTIEQVRRAAPSLRESSLIRNRNKLCAVFNWADFHRNGNIPFLWGEGLGKAQLLRHPVPTIEKLLTVELAPEYTMFLGQLAKKKEKVLYCCLLNPDTRDEKARIGPLYGEFAKRQKTAYFMRLPMDGALLDLLEDGNREEEFALLEAKEDDALLCEATSAYRKSDETENFDLLWEEVVGGLQKTNRTKKQNWLDVGALETIQECPQEDDSGSEGSWECGSVYSVTSEDYTVSKQDQEEVSILSGTRPRYSTLDTYASFVETSVQNSLCDNPSVWNKNTFIFSENVQRILRENPQVFKQIRAVAETIITEDINENIDIIKSQKAYYMLFCTLLRLYVIQKAGITYYNNTCKDAIDRGAAHLVSDLAFRYFCEGNLSKQVEEELALALTGPAFLAKTQAILADRAEWALCLCDVLSQAEKSEAFDAALAILLGSA